MSKDKPIQLGIVGHVDAGMMAQIESLKEQGIGIEIVDSPPVGLNLTYNSSPMINKMIDEELSAITKLHDYPFSEYKPKPKHHNGKYNRVNRKKNKASKKARKQNKK